MFFSIAVFVSSCRHNRKKTKPFPKEAFANYSCIGCGWDPEQAIGVGVAFSCCYNPLVAMVVFVGPYHSSMFVFLCFVFLLMMLSTPSMLCHGACSTLESVWTLMVVCLLIVCPGELGLP